MFQHVRSVALAAAVIALAGAARVPWAQAAEIRDVGERVFPFERGGEIVIDSQNGRIVVEAWDKPQVRIQITRTVRAGDADRANALMRDLRADVEVGATQIQIRSRFPKIRESVGIWDLLGRKVAALHIHYYLQVPTETSLAVETSNGEIRVRGIRGEVTGETVNGDVEISGPAAALEVKTTNGEIRLTGVGGSAVARTTNGGITARFVSVPSRGRVDLGTTNGSVVVSLPRGLKATLEAATTNGRVIVGYPLTAQGVISSKTVRGTIGGGGARIALRTTNGNIEVVPAGSRRDL